MLHDIYRETKTALDTPVIEVVTDKRYESRADILNCLMNGSIPHVALKFDKNARVLAILSWPRRSPMTYIEVRIRPTKVAAELALSFSAYNLKRVIRLLGHDPLLRLLKNKKVMKNLCRSVS